MRVSGLRQTAFAFARAHALCSVFGVSACPRLTYASHAHVARVVFVLLEGAAGD